MRAHGSTRLFGGAFSTYNDSSYNMSHFARDKPAVGWLQMNRSSSLRNYRLKFIKTSGGLPIVVEESIAVNGEIIGHNNLLRS